MSGFSGGGTPNLHTAGGNSITLTSTADTNVTLPASGTLAKTTDLLPIGGSNLQVQYNNNGAFGGLTDAAIMNRMVAAGALRSYIAGLTLSNDGGTPNSVLDIAAGSAADSTNAVMIVLGAFTKSTAGAWAAGSGSNGMGNGLTIANSTWYHVFVAIVSGAADVFFDTSVTAANAPTGTTAFRRIGSFKTDGSAHILTFVQDEETFWWGAVVDDSIAATGDASGGINMPVTVPTGVKVQPMLRVDQGSNIYWLITSFDETNVAVVNNTTSPGMDLNSSVVVAGISISPYLYTNTSAQLRLRASASTNSAFKIFTRGWVDRRGRFA